MSNRGRPRFIAAAVGALLASATVVVFFRFAGATTVAAPALNSVDMAVLSRAGITLAAPAGIPAIQKDEAELIILNRYRVPNVAITEIVLAQYQSRRISGTGTLCWVASVAGINRQISAPGAPLRILTGPLVVAVDATTGSVLETWQSTAPPSAPAPSPTG